MADKNYGTIKTGITTGNNDFNITVGVDFKVHEVNISVPAGIGNITYRLYDGVVSDAKPLTEALYLAASGNVKLNSQITDSAGELGIRIAGWTSGGTNAFVNVRARY